MQNFLELVEVPSNYELEHLSLFQYLSLVDIGFGVLEDGFPNLVMVLHKIFPFFNRILISLCLRCYTFPQFSRITSIEPYKVYELFIRHRLRLSSLVVCLEVSFTGINGFNEFEATLERLASLQDGVLIHHHYDFV